MKLSLKSRLLVIITGTAVLAVALASASFFAYDSATFQARMSVDQVTLAETLRTPLTTAVVYNDDELIAQILSGLEMQPSVVAAAVYDAEGARRAEYRRASDGWPETQPSGTSGSGSRFETDALIVHQSLVFSDREVGALLVRSNLDELAERRHAFAQILLAVFGGVSAIAFLLASYLQRSVSVPLSSLAKVAREVSLRRDYSLRARRYGNDEIAVLTDDFNHMLGQIEERDEELRHARDEAEQANRSKSVFLASMSHELRTPLTAIIGYSEFLEDDAEELGLDNFLPDLGKIKSAGKHLLGLINSILDLSKVEAGKMELYLESFDIAELVNDVATTVRPLIERKSNRLEVRCADGLEKTVADLTKTRQILFNLLSNAAKFTEQGRVLLEVEQKQEFGGEWFVYRIVDSGIGMSRDQRERLFKPFSQADASTARNYGGTGLGLALCKRFCELMGGFIDVDSKLGEGSTFTVWLPKIVVDPANPGSKELPVVDEIKLQEMSRRRPLSGSIELARWVLVIDDDPAVLELLHGMLRDLGFQVELAQNGEEGLAKARELKPDIITLDVRMPGLDGWSVLSKLKAEPALADTPVIMISVSDEREKGYAMGADYLTKPIDRHRLAALLERHQVQGRSPEALVVDDEPEVRELLVKVLIDQGWNVREAPDGLAALRQVADSKPDLILLDLIMPNLDGFGFLDQLRRNSGWREIPVAVLTAMDIGPEERQKLNGGVDRVLQKSAFSIDELKQEIRSLARLGLDKSKTRADSAS